MRNTQHELLPIVVQEQHALVDASLLHRRLKSGTPFHTWIKRRIEEYDFINGQDFYTNLFKSSGGRPATGYMLTLDMAKELAMLERNEVGRNIRRYFIEKEKELRSISHLPAGPQLFKGLKAKTVNDRRMYPYKEILSRCGYSTKAGTGQRRAKYWQHFIKEGHMLFITEEFALHLHHQKQVFNNRTALKAMQPVLPLDFGKGGIA